VWASLARDYPSQGTSIRVDAPPIIGSRAKANPSRRPNPLTQTQRLYHGGPVAVGRPKAGTFLTPDFDTASTYALHGPNQTRRTPLPGVVSNYELAARARVQTFPSFADAYAHYGASSTQSLAKRAVQRAEADIVAVYDEFILVVPDIVRYAGSEPIVPTQKNPRRLRRNAMVGHELGTARDGTKIQLNWGFHPGGMVWTITEFPGGVILRSDSADKAFAAFQEAFERHGGRSNPRRRNPRKPQTETPTSSAAFRRWFGDSKVVDAEGNPLVVYHAGFDVLRSSEGAFRVSYSGRAGMGIYFTPSLSGAERYLGRAHAMHRDHVKIAEYDGLPVPTPPTITAAYLSVQNPAIVDRSEAGGREPSEMLASMVVPKRRYRNLDYELEDLLRYTRKAGYDGVFVTNGEEVEEILVFDPRQVKSATANVGTFDPADPDIRRNPRSRTRRTRSRR
jgi:hypothetical protein